MDSMDRNQLTPVTVVDEVSEVPADAILKFPTIHVGPFKYVLPENGREFLRDIYDFEPRPTDVVVMGFSRSGTTVTQEMVWMICSNLDLERSHERTLTQRFPCLEHRMIYAENARSFPDRDRSEYVSDVWREFMETQENRFMKTHLPFGLLSPRFLASGAKILYLIRDPREVIVSNYKMCLKLVPNDFDEGFEKFWIAFRDNRYFWTPFFQTIVEAWDRKKADNLLLLSYRGFVKSQRQTIKLVAKFLEEEVTEERCTNLQIYLSHKRIKEQDLHKVLANAKNEVFRRNDDEWKTYFAGPLEAEVNTWVEDNLKKHQLPPNMFELHDFSGV